MIKKSFIVGITGGSGSGKTLFLKKLTEALGEHLCVISQDDYYHPITNQPLDVNGVENFDTPNSIDLNQFKTDIHQITNGKVIQRKQYTFNNPAVSPAIIEYKPAPIIIVEGIFLLHETDLFNMLDLSIFIEVKEHIKLKRRIVRDQSERGYDVTDILYRYENHVSPTFEKYIQPFKDQVDLIIPNNHQYEKALEVLIGFLKNKLTDLA